MKSASNCLPYGPELAELEPGVADDAGIGRATLRVFVDEVVHDLLEVALEIEGIKRHVELIGDAAGIAGIDGSAAAFLAVGGRAHRRRGYATPVRMNRPMTS